MTSDHTNRDRAHARMVMEAIELLHSYGYGRLKLYSYLKDGLPAWRYILFAADCFPSKVDDLPKPLVCGSVPTWIIADGESKSELAEALLSKYPELFKSAHGRDDIYVSWYRRMLSDHPDDILLMERQDIAEILDYGIISTPYEKLNEPFPEDESSRYTIELYDDAINLHPELSSYYFQGNFNKSPPYEAWPDGCYRCYVTVNIINVDNKPVFQAEYILKETIEMRDANEKGPLTGSIGRELFLLSDESGISRMKEYLKPFALKFRKKNAQMLINLINNTEVDLVCMTIRCKKESNLFFLFSVAIEVV